MAYLQSLTLRQEVILDRGLKGVDLANIKDETGEHLEAETAAFLDANIFPSMLKLMLLNAFSIPFLGSN